MDRLTVRAQKSDEVSSRPHRPCLREILLYVAAFLPPSCSANTVIKDETEEWDLCTKTVLQEERVSPS